MRLCKTLPYVLVAAVRPVRAAEPRRELAGRRRHLSSGSRPQRPIDASLLAGLALALHRSCTGRTLAGGRRQFETASGVLLRRDGRRRVEDDRWRPQLAPGRRTSSLRSSSVGAIARLRIQPRRRLRRDGGNAASRQHHPGRRRLQDDRRRPHVDPRRPREDARDRPHPRPSRESGHRLRRGARRSVRSDARSRRLQVHRRRQDLDARPVP